MNGPTDCVVAVTYRCNSRCVMCDIWKSDSDRERELVPEDYRWLPRSLKSINVSGGEPFLRDDLVDIVKVMRERCPRARIVISTNGLESERIESAMAQMSGVAVRVSVDGIGAAHEAIRRVPGAYEKAMKTVRLLTALGVEDLGLAATATDSNIGEVTKVRDKARELGIRFVATAAHSSPIFFGDHSVERPHTGESVREMAGIMKSHLSSWNPMEWAKAYYVRGLVEYIRGRPRRLPCRAGTDFFFLDPWGGVYPCNIGGTLIGNIRDGSFREIRRRAWQKVKESVDSCEVQCWMVCTVSAPMKRRPLKPILWMLGAKLLRLDTRVDS
ncbi:radical SAM protein [bacterium]|nr:radical SAM protein [bacterium]